ncbi:uncharacterized protein TrAFT101_010914 [Trichoderma asperellum]|uniref:Heterokaryon incompatibility domain-containing protein n=1 Tax=Trichoderma asperellum (strain ATCC 204424 / CBS 433.97 / NBRC 101777) TaxID=1042311 RepID=A0A2T3YXB8_TRIA4|nr:hypothetical protein M441DRAFT_61196 [Trichoderma asperellum CBS 433.97]PTB37180.1 hypothetical protein M441DRAFT_61196 [Trichoderma asperellum CBS 433.97]UKZ96112.1 hypothetical protein TrAFT101_010914 [Trichoderma asperellum]
MDDQLENPAQSGEAEDTSKRAKLAMKMRKSMGLNQEPADDQLETSAQPGESEDISKRAKLAMKMIKTMGLNQEMIRSIVTSWLVPQFKPEIIAEYGQHLAKIHDVGFLGVSNTSTEVSRPFRMFDIADGMLVEDIDPSAPYCMVSHRWKDPEINLDLLQRVKKKVSKSYPTWYNTDRTDVEMILKYCKEKIQKQRKKVNGCAVKNRLDEKLAQKDCYVLSLLRMYHHSKKIRKEVKDAHSHLEKMIRDKKVTDMESRVFRDLSNKAKYNIDDTGIRASLANPEEQQPAIDDTEDDIDAIKAAYERVFDAEWERDKHSDDAKFDALSRDLREMVEKMVRCLRLWRSAIKIEQSILKVGEIFRRGLVPGYKQQQKFYVWLDTCCIDKSNHNEYSESMSLMGDWYAQSAFTLVHLDTGFDKLPDKSDAEIYWDEYLQTDGDYHKLETIANRRTDSIQKYEDIAKEPEIEWSTRGWTLQELVMSRMTYYVNADWRLLPRPVENLGRAYHLIPHMGLYTNLLGVKPTPNAWKPEVLMTALLNCGAVQYTEAIKAVYPRIEQESDEEEVEEGFSLSNALLASIAMPWNIMDTVFHVTKPEPAQNEKTKVKFSGDALLREIAVIWDQNLASQFPQVEENGKNKEKQKAYKVNEHLRLEDNLNAEDRVSHALSIIKALELVGLCFPRDISSETAKTEIAQAVFFATMALAECYEQTKYPMVIREVATQENMGKKRSDREEKAILKQKREIEKRVKLEIRKRLFQELLDSFPEAKEHYSIETIESLEEKEEAIAKTFAHILHVLVDEVNDLILDDRQYIAEFGNITLLDSWVDGTRRHGFTTQEVMALACKRKTTKSFDRAYSLMGILGVRFPTFPAEGYEKALCRLFDETVTSRNDVSVFNWAGYSKGSSIRGRSMYPSTQEAYQIKNSRLHSRNSMAETEKDKMLQTTSYYHALVSLLRDLIEFLKKTVPAKQVVEWIGYISAIIYSFDLENLKAAPTAAEKADKLSGRSNISNGANALPYEIEVLSKFIGYIINGPAQIKPDPNRLLSSTAIRNPRFEVDINPDIPPVLDPPAQIPVINNEQLGRDFDPNTNQTEGISPPEPVDVPLPTEDRENESPTVGRKSRFVEQLSEAGSAPVPLVIGDNDTSQIRSNIPLSENDEISRYLQNWATKSLRGVREDPSFFETQIPAKVQGIRHKIEKQHRENGVQRTASFGSPNMVSPHPIIVTNAGIESIFDIQRVIVTMADLQGLRQQVEHATSPDQIISGYCSISTGFAQVIVQFSCKSEILRKQLEVIDGIDFRVMKEQNKKEDKKREHKMTSKVLWEKMKKEKKSREEKKKKKDKREESEPDQVFSVDLEEVNGENEAVNNVSGEAQSRDLDEEKTINRMIKFIQEDDLRLVAGEWVLARCSGVANADWFLCHLELGSTHPFYGYRIPTSEIDFNNCIPEDGLVTEWNRYMNRKKEEMCKILATFLKSKEHKLKRRRLVGRIMRDLAPLDEKAEEELQETPRSSLERNGTNGLEMNGTNGLEGVETHEEHVNPIQHEYDYLDDFAENRNDDNTNDAGRLTQPFSELYSQDSISSVQHDDVWSALQDPNSQYSTTSVEAQDMWGNQELRPEDSVSNYGDRDSRPSQEPPSTSFDSMTVTGGNVVVEVEEEEAEEKSKLWDYLPLIEKVAEKTAKHYDKHLSATVLKDTPTVLRQAIENLNDNRDFLPAMFHSAKKIHMF